MKRKSKMFAMRMNELDCWPVSGDDRYDQKRDWDDDIENGTDFEKLGGYAPPQGYVAGQAQRQVAGIGVLISLLFSILLKLLKIW